MRIGRRSGSLALVLMVVACERSPETITGNAPRPSMATTTSTAGATNPQATIGINVLLKGPATAAQVAELNRLGTVYDQIPELNALLMRAKAGQLAAIQALPFVVAANPDAERKGAPVDGVSVSDFVLGRNTWDLDAINVTNLVPGPDNDRTITFDGSGVYVGVLDTGLLDSWRQYFPEQRIDTQHATAFSGGGASGNGNVPDLPNQWEHDQNSHGTHVTSTILGYSLFGTSINGVAPLATVIPVKVLKQSGFGWSSMVARGIIYVADLKTGPLAGHPVVINMSLGGPTLDAVEQAAIDFAISKGVIIVAAAGNEGEKGMGFPGAYGPVISAAASGWIGEWQPGADGNPRNWWIADDVPETGAANFYIAEFSSREKAGQDLDVAAPGSWVVGPFQLQSGKISYFFLGGTSMASPHVAGIVALMAQKKPSLTASEAENILEATAMPLPTPPAPGRLVRNPNGTTRLVTWGADATGAGLVQANAALAATTP